MVKKNEAPVDTVNTAPESDDEPPAGFTEAAPDIDGWCKLDKGLIVHGKIVGHMRIKAEGGGKRDVCLVKVLRPTPAVSADPETKGDAITLQKGMVLAVGISHALKGMLDYVEKQGYVWFKVESKKKLNGSNKSVWKADVRFKGTKAPLMVAAEVASDEIDDGDIPF